MPDIKYSVDPTRAVEGFREIEKAADLVKESVTEASQAIERAEKGISSVAAARTSGGGAERTQTVAAERAQRTFLRLEEDRRAASAARLAEEEGRSERLAAVIQESDAERHRKLLSLQGSTSKAESDAIRRNSELERQSAKLTNEERLRGIRQVSREDAERLKQREAQERAAEARRAEGRRAAERVQLFVDPGFAVGQRRIQLENDLRLAVERGAISQQRANVIRQQAERILENQAVQIRRVAQAQNSLGVAVGQLSRSFSVLAFGPLSGVGARLITFQVLSENLRSTFGAQGGSFGARVGLIGAVAGLAAAFTALGTSLIVGQRLVRTALEFQQIESTLRVAATSAEGAARSFAFVEREADRIGLPLAEAARQFARLEVAARGTSLAGEESRKIFTALSGAAVVLGLSSDQLGGAFNAVVQIISKGTVQAEELRGQLGERLPGAFELAARGLGVTTQELNRLLVSGQVLATDLIPALAEELERAFGPQVATASRNLRAELARLGNAIDALFREAGESGFVDAFTESIRKLTEVVESPGLQQGLTGLATNLGRVLDIIDEHGDVIAVLLAAGGVAALGGGLAGAGVAAAVTSLAITINEETGAFARQEAALNNLKDELKLFKDARNEFLREEGPAAPLIAAFDALNERLARARSELEGLQAEADDIAAGIISSGVPIASRFIDPKEVALAASTAIRFIKPKEAALAEELRREITSTEAAIRALGLSKEEVDALRESLKEASDEAKKASESFFALVDIQQDLKDIAAQRAVIAGGGTFEDIQAQLRELEILREIRDEQKKVLDSEGQLSAVKAILIARRVRNAAALEDEIAALEKKNDESEKEAELLKEATKRSLDRQREIQNLQERIAAFQQGGTPEEIRSRLRELEVRQRIVELQHEELETGGQLTNQQAEEIAQREILIGLTKEQEAALSEMERAVDRATRAQERALRAAAEALTKPFENALDNIQDRFTDLFESILNGGIDSFDDFAKSVRDIMIRLAAEIGTLLVFRPVVQQLAGAAAVGGFGGGVLEALLGATTSASNRQVQGQTQLTDLGREQLRALDQIEKNTLARAGEGAGIFADTAQGIDLERRRQEVLETQTKELSGVNKSVASLGGFLGPLSDNLSAGIGAIINFLGGQGLNLSSQQQINIAGAFGGGQLGNTVVNLLTGGGLGRTITGTAAGVITINLSGLADLGEATQEIGALGSFIGSILGQFDIFPGGAIGGGILGGGGASALAALAQGQNPFAGVGLAGAIQAGAGLGTFAGFGAQTIGAISTVIGSSVAGPVGSFLSTLGPILGSNFLTAALAALGTLGGILASEFSEVSKSGIALITTKTLEEIPSSPISGPPPSFQGPFGFVAQDIRFAKNIGGQTADLLALTFGQLDLQFSKFLSVSEVAKVAEALQGETFAGRASNAPQTINELVVRRIRAILEAIEIPQVLISNVLQSNLPVESIERGKQQLEQAAEFIRQRAAIQQTETQLRVFAGLEQLPTAFEAFVKTIREAVDELRLLGPTVGIATETLDALADAAIAAGRTEISDRIALEVLGITNPLAAALQVLTEEFDERARELEAAGIDLAELERLFDLRREQAIEEANRAINDFIEQQTLQPAAATLPETRIFENLQRFAELETKIREGEAIPTERTEIVDVARNLVGALQEQFGFTEPFFTRRDEILESLRALRETTEAVAGANDEPNALLRDVGVEIARGNAAATESTEELLTELRRIRAVNEELVELTRSGQLQMQEAG